MRGFRFLPVAMVGFCLAGCGDSGLQEWTQDQMERCRAQSGVGVFLRQSKTLECWRRSVPLSLKLEFNKDVGYKSADPVLLYTVKFEPVNAG